MNRQITLKYIIENEHFIICAPMSTDSFIRYDVEEVYAHFWFEKEYALNWLEDGILWQPSSRPFQSWDTFKDKQRYTRIESYYSKFQCYILYALQRMTTLQIQMEFLVDNDKESLHRRIEKYAEAAKYAVKSFQKHEKEKDKLAAITIRGIGVNIVGNGMQRWFLKTLELLLKT